MVPVITASGRSFRGAFDYYCRDKNAATTARVAWTQTVNLLTECTDKAWKVMAYTAKHAAELKRAAGIASTGRKTEKPVFAYSLSWHPEQKPSKEDMMAAAQDSLERLGLSDHQTLIAAHNDEPQPHIHIVVNKVHPLTGKTADLKFSKRVLSDFAREHEIKDGKIYCQQRVDNHRKREQGQKTKHGNPVLEKAWRESRGGRDFATQLKAEGYDLARGRKRLVVVDPYGKVLNPVRLLPGVKARVFQDRLKDLDPKALPTPEQILETRKQGRKTKENAPTPVQATEPSLASRKESLKQRYKEAARTKLIELKAYHRITEKRDRVQELQDELSSQGPIINTVRNWLGLNTKLREDLAVSKAEYIKARESVETDYSRIVRQQKRQLKRSLSHLEQIHQTRRQQPAARQRSKARSVRQDFSQSVSQTTRTPEPRSKQFPNDQDLGPSMSR